MNRLRQSIIVLAAVLTLGVSVYAGGFGFSHGRDSRQRSIDVHVSNRSFAVSVSKRHYNRGNQRTVFARNGGRRVWLPGHYKFATERVWVPVTREKVWIEPAYQTVYDTRGEPSSVAVRRGRWEIVEAPGHYEKRRVRVWRAGHWSRLGRQY